MSQFSGLLVSGLSRFSGLILLLDWQQKWPNHIIVMILFSGWCHDLVDIFAATDKSTKSSLHCIPKKGPKLDHFYTILPELCAQGLHLNSFLLDLLRNREKLLSIIEKFAWAQIV